MDSADIFYTVSEVAHLLKLNPLTIYQYIQDGKIAAIRFNRSYRIEKTELDKFIESHRVGGSYA
jgi:excisionase family DNA binding protein